jgi:hypothetical protein
MQCVVGQLVLGGYCSGPGLLVPLPAVLAAIRMNTQRLARFMLPVEEVVDITHEE